MAPAENSPELRVRLLRELARRLYWAGLTYALFAALFSMNFEPGGRAVAWALTIALTVLGAVRTHLSHRIVASGDGGATERAGRRLLATTRVHGLAFCLFISYAIWHVRGQTTLECLLVVGVAGFSSGSASVLSPFPEAAWVHVGGQVFPIYIWTFYALPRYGWLLGALVLMHSVAIVLLVRMASAHTRGMFVAQLTLEAQSEDLRQARDLAEAAGSARMRFLANMSHEIRTPLNGIMGLTEVLGDTRLTLDQRQLLEDLDRSGRHLLSIVDGILDMAKVTSGKLTLENVAFDLPLLIRDVAAPAAALAEAKRVRFLVDAPPDLPPWVVGDPVRIRQVLSNLLSNAVKFTEAGEVRLAVTAPRRGWGRFDVSDTGIGLSPEQLGILFQEFHQVDSSTTRRFGGTGLGLAISQRLVEMMGGRIAVESRLGHGARFSVEIPVPPGKAALPAAAQARGSVRLPAGLRVLVAEDNPVNQRVIERMVARTGARVDVAGNGRRAVELHSERPYDIILMDCQMPEVDGYEATALIRALPDSRSLTPILGVTANAFSEDRERCHSAGMDGHVAKPLGREALLEAMSKVLRESRARRSEQECVPHGAV
ncbi:MAG: ATP-binding protein [Bryobacteraceae bacterium]